MLLNLLEFGHDAFVLLIPWLVKFLVYLDYLVFVIYDTCINMHVIIYKTYRLIYDRRNKDFFVREL